VSEVHRHYSGLSEGTIEEMGSEAENSRWRRRRDVLRGQSVPQLDPENWTAVTSASNWVQ